MELEPKSSVTEPEMFDAPVLPTGVVLLKLSLCVMVLPP